MFQHLLVPTDGSPLSQKAIDRAIEFAAGIGARITFFFAEPSFPAMYYGTGVIFDPSTPRKYHEEIDNTAQELLNRAITQATQARVTSDKLALTSDNPYQAIIEAADRCQCDLIFMASHGRKGVNALLLGSETQKVLTHSSIPVLVHR